MSKRNRKRSIGQNRRRKTTSIYDVLEGRRLLAVSVTLQGDVLTILGDADANDVLVQTNSVDDTYDVTLDFGEANTDAGSFAQSAVTSIVFTGRGGDDFMNNSTSLPMTAYG